MKAKQILKKVLVIVIGIMMVLSLAACSKSAEPEKEEAKEEAAEEEAEAEEAEAAEESDEAKAAAYNKILAELKANAPVAPEGTLTVAMSPDFAPMEFVDLARSGDEQYVGFDVLLSNYIANELGMALEIKPMSFDATQAAVQTGSVDLGISGFSWTEERAKNYFITDWYEAGDNETQQVVITTAENEGKFATAEDFAGLKIGAQGASLQKVLVEAQLADAELMLYENLNDAVTSLLTGKIDVLAVAHGNGEAFIAANEGKLAFSGFEFEVDEMYKNNVILMNKNNEELGQKVNEVLAKLKTEDNAVLWYEACQMLAEIKTLDELGYDDDGNKIEE